MDMDYMDPFRQRYSGLVMQTFGAYQPPVQPVHPVPPGQPPMHSVQPMQPEGPQYPYWNHLMAFYQHQQRAAAMMGQGAMHLPKPTEPKPRLAKDEVELLEREFAKNPKPSSSTKRELAERMGVEVPRINNWFQNRRAKEKQLRKTAEFEAQQARERAASESKFCNNQDQGRVSELYGLSDQQRPAGLSTAAIGDEGDTAEKDGAAAERKFADPADSASAAAAPAGENPADPDSDSLAHIKAEPPASPAGQAQESAEQVPPATSANHISETHAPGELRQAQDFALGSPDGNCPPHSDVDPFPSHSGTAMSDAAVFSPFPDQDYFATPSVAQFTPDMILPPAVSDVDNQLLRHQASAESLERSDILSPTSMPDSPSTVSELRFKSPPPPADIAGRRKMRRPAPLGLSSLRGAPGPKTGIEAPRRADTASPMRRISSATGSLCGRVLKSSMGPSGPRSPFAMDRNKEALLQSIQSTQAPIMTSLNSAISPMNSDGMVAQSVGENMGGANPLDEDQSHLFGSFGAVSGLPAYTGESVVKTPPDTPGLQTALAGGYFTGTLDNTWNLLPQDEPLPTPSLCSHGGSELEFSMAPQLPGYAGSQPVTPSFPPAMGPTYTGYFGTSLGYNTEYQFPDSYPAESSARSSPVAPPRSKQFQFAQNVTPQDFNTDRT